MKLTRKQIETIIENTPKELDGKHNSFQSDFGYYMKANANWSYQAGYIKHEGGLVLVVKVFGQIQTKGVY